MSWASINFLVALLLAQNKIVTPDIPGLGDIQTYANFANDAIGVIKGDLPGEALLLGSTGPTLDKILASIADIGDQLADFSSRTEKKLDKVVDTIVETIKTEGKLRPALRDLHKNIERIDALYQRFEYYSQNRSRINEYTIKKFAHTITSNGEGDLQNVLDKLQSLIIPGRSSEYSDSIVTLLGKKIRSEEPTDQCNTGGSTQLKLYNFYDAVVMCEARGFLMSLFVYSVLTVYENSTFYFELDMLKDQLVKRSNDYLLETQKEMGGLRRNIELCDARRYKLGINYVTFPIFLSLSLAGHCMPTAPQLTDIENNRILIGVRWMLKKNMLQIQIKEGSLIPNGRTDPKTERWIPVPDYDFENEEFFEIGEDKTSRKLEKSEYIAFLDESKLFLDDILFSPEYVVTGLRAKKNNDEEISLEYRGTKFDFHTGRLLLDGDDASIWRSFEDMKNDNPSKDYKRDRSLLDSRWLTSSAKAPFNEVDSVPNQWLEFTFSNDNDGIRTIPFFDIRPVTGSPSIALSGMGLMHRGHEEYAGYVNFRLFNIDISQYIHTTYDSAEDYA